MIVITYIQVHAKEDRCGRILGVGDGTDPNGLLSQARAGWEQ